MLSQLSPDAVLTSAAQILLPMIAAQLLCRLADRKVRFAKRLMPTTAKRILWLTVGVILSILIIGAAAFLLRAGIAVYFLISGAVVGLITGIASASISDSEED